MGAVVVTQDDLVEGFQRLGLGAGDAAFVHSSLSSFGAAAEGVYAELGNPDGFELLLESGPHAMTPTAFEKAAGWLAAKLGSNE